MPRCAAERKNHGVDISVQFMGYLAYGTTLTQKKGASQGRKEKGTIVGVVFKSGSADVLYLFRRERGKCSTVLF